MGSRTPLPRSGGDVWGCGTRLFPCLPPALPRYTGELGLRLSGELLLLLLLPPLSGERRCRPFALPGSSGGVALGAGGGLPLPPPPRVPPGPVPLPAEAEGERVGLRWPPRSSW